MFFRRKNFLENYLDDKNLIKRPRPWWLKVWPWFLAIFLVILVFAVPLAVSGFGIYSKLLSLNTQAEAMMASVKGGQLGELSGQLQSIENDLLAIKTQARQAGPILFIPPIGQTAKTIDQMLAATVDLLSGYRELLGIFTDLEATTNEGQVVMNFSTPEGKKNILESIAKNRDAIERAKTKIKTAKQTLANINTNDLSGLFKSKVMAANSLLAEIIDQTDVALPLFKYLPELAGLNQEKNYLILFQNNMELRPTGGFIGSYGVVTVKNGEILKIQTDDIYNLDKLSKEKLKVPAPWPMTTYNNQKYLFLRDANWSPDWPTSAKEIKWFWDEERKNAGLPVLPLDGIIAITPDFIANFLELTGPIEADGITFDHKNFASELEQAVEFNYAEKGIPMSERKSIIGDLTSELIRRLMALSPRELLDAWLVMKKNINEKQVIVWLSDNVLQAQIAQENWSGEVKASDLDYLYVVDANLGALKTDQVMKRKIKYSVDYNENGDLISRAEITYQHSGKPVEALISRYRTYTRVYVPENSWFLKAYTQDDKGIFNYTLLKDAAITSELGKKTLGMFLQVDPEKTKTLIVEYRLPESVKKTYQNGLYKLIVQKQPGTAGHGLQIDLKFAQLITAYHAPLLPVSFNGHELIFNSDLQEDREFIVKF
jgi:hypothetical protein